MLYNRVLNLRVLLCKPFSQKLLLRTYRRPSPPHQSSSVVLHALKGPQKKLMDPEVDETPAAKRLKQDGPAKDSAQAAAASAHEAQHQGAASSMPAGPASQGEEKQPGRKLSRKEKQLQKDPAKAKSAEIYRGIQMCARSGDLAAAVSYLEQAQAEGMRLQLSSFNSLMYLAVGGDRWEALARQGFPAQRAVENVRDAGRLASNSTASSSKSSGSSGSEGEESDREDGGRQDGRSEGSSRGVSVQEGAPGGKQATSTPPAPDAPPRKKRGRPPSEKTLAARAAAAAAAAAAAEGGNVQGAQQDAGSGGKTGLSGDGAPASVDAGSGKVGQVDEDQSPAAVGRLEHVAAASKVWSAMQAAGVAPDTGTYLALARMEGLRGDPDASLNWVKTCLSSGLSIQLRMVHPALVGYCMQRNSAAALQLDAFLTEQVRGVLGRMGISTWGLAEQVGCVLGG
uniref:PROP1-like PPR domain-containing protein n=1 Tax=Dunaliella tertiolecta TaxID=3047 RepID=A0A7S3R1R8_DUNTE